MKNDVSKEMLFVPTYSVVQPKLVKRAISKTEQIVLDNFVEVDLENWSNPLLYAKGMNKYRNGEKKAIFNLVYNGHLRIIESYENGTFKRVLTRAEKSV